MLWMLTFQDPEWIYVFVNLFNDIIDSLYLIGRGGNGNPLQYSCLENSMDRGSWQVIVHGVAESDTTEPAHTYTHPLDRNWGKSCSSEEEGIKCSTRYMTEDPKFRQCMVCAPWMVRVKLYRAVEQESTISCLFLFCFVFLNREHDRRSSLGNDLLKNA